MSQTEAPPAAATAVSALALAAAAPTGLHPEPEWITRAADELGYAWARAAWQKAASQPGAWFHAEKADAVVALWPKAFKLTSGRFAGRAFRLAFWQEVVVRLLVGWKIPIEVLDEDTGAPKTIYVRLFQELRLWIARKNGKSEFLAALALLFWAIEGEQRGQGYCFARNEAQARVVFEKIGDMIAYAPSLAKDSQIFASSIWLHRLKARFQVLTGKAKGKHGRGATVTVGDEVHEWKDKELADTMRQSEAGALQPIRLYASTASPKGETVGNEMYDESLKILDGRLDQPTVLVVIFTVPEEADWHDEKVWAFANPSLGLSPTLRHLREEHAKALDNARAEAQFRCYHLNQFVEQFARWLPLKKWDAGYTGPHWTSKDAGWRRYPDELKGRDCYLSFDSTQSFDPASICLRFPPKEPGEKIKHIWRFFMPAETIAERSRNEQVPFEKWRDEGVLTEIPGATFVLQWAIRAAAEARKLYNVKLVGWDAWNALEFYNRLVTPLPDDEISAFPEELFVKLRFGTATLGLPSKEFEGEVFRGEVDHGANPMARWMAGHCDIRFDENMNFVPAKKRSGKNKSIDGIVTAVMTKAAAMSPDTRVDLDSWLKAPMVIRQ
jgi:phage terminase large subunit-like protein